MLIIPSISLLEGKIVKRIQTTDGQSFLYFDKKPVEFAKEIEDNGFKFLHVVNLSDKFAGRRLTEDINYDVLCQLHRFTNLEIWFDGGVRSPDDLQSIFEAGVKKIIATTLAVLQPDLFYNWTITYNRNNLMLGIDVQGEYVMVNGRTRITDTKWTDLLNFYDEKGILYIKLTDIFRDGLLSGPNFDMYQRATAAHPEQRFFASGGVRHIDDIHQLNHLGLFGVFINRALMEGVLTLAQLRALSEEL